ncbi:hypothetical protein JCM5350_003103 [Sporobolomyces pararoseus]
MSTELSNSTKMDRLSSLPPELLSDIFDLAHDPDQPLTEPLSRSLLPYFRFGTHDAGPTARDLLSLVEGPTRIQHLEWLVLHSLMGSEGKRFDVGDSVGPLTGDLGEDWNIPDFEWAEGWDVSEIERLSQAGERNGVKVTGLTIEAVKVWHAAQLELANRLILQAYQTKSLDDYIAEKATQSPHGRLPDLDVDQLDPENLKLVKIDLPEEDWFQFTLE